MSRGEFNKFGCRGYVRLVIDGRGMTFLGLQQKHIGEIVLDIIEPNNKIT